LPHKTNQFAGSREENEQKAYGDNENKTRKPRNIEAQKNKIPENFF